MIMLKTHLFGIYIQVPGYCTVIWMFTSPGVWPWCSWQTTELENCRLQSFLRRICHFVKDHLQRHTTKFISPVIGAGCYLSTSLYHTLYDHSVVFPAFGDRYLLCFIVFCDRCDGKVVATLMYHQIQPQTQRVSLLQMFFPQLLMLKTDLKFFNISVVSEFHTP